MSSLPQEIILEIFLRLPVKSLIRFRCVCKPLCTLICSPNFVKMHLNLTTRKNNPSIMFHDWHDCGGDLIYSVDYKSLLLLPSSTPRWECEVLKMDHPLISPDFKVQILGSCNGLFCICTSVTGGDGQDVMCLWNPSTKEYKKVPTSPNQFSSRDTGLYGFGYDNNIEDYKLVRVIDFVGHKDNSEVEVYTLGSDSWKCNQTIPYWFPTEKIPGVLVNEALHWLCATRTNKSDIIVSLNIGNEKFDEVPLPKEPMPHPEEHLVAGQFNKNVGVIGGSLCLLLNVFKVRVEVWFMQDYGVRESWIKRFTLTQETLIGNMFFRPLLSYKNGEILFRTEQNLVLYDPQNQRGKKLMIYVDSRFLLEAENYVASLVSLNSGTYVEPRKIKGKPIEHEGKPEV